MSNETNYSSVEKRSERVGNFETTVIFVSNPIANYASNKALC